MAKKPRQRGRPSVLTEPMKAEIARRMSAGEQIRPLAREFKVGEATLRRNFSAQLPQIQEIAQMLSRAETELAQLPISAQRAIRSLADQLKEIERNYAQGAESGARSASRLHGLADRASARLVQRADEEGLDPKDIAVVSALHQTANQGAQMASNMIAANKGTISESKESSLSIAVSFVRKK